MNKNIYNHYLDKRSDIMKITQFKVKDVFGDVLGKEIISRKQITEIVEFLAKMI